jgi:hypothetical protein
LAHFGDLKVGQTGEETITLACRSGRLFDVAGIQCASKGVDVIPIASGRPDSKLFRVRLKSSAVGTQDSEVLFAIRYRVGSQANSMRLSETAVFNVRCFGVQ